MSAELTDPLDAGVMRAATIVLVFQLMLVAVNGDCKQLHASVMTLYTFLHSGGV